MPREQPGTLGAVVILRSRSGRSLHDLSTATSLDADGAPPAATDLVRRAFESQGFTVVPDSHLPALTLTGPASLFAACFNIPEAALVQGDRDTPLQLQPL